MSDAPGALICSCLISPGTGDIAISLGQLIPRSGGSRRHHSWLLPQEVAGAGRENCLSDEAAGWWSSRGSVGESIVLALNRSLLEAAVEPVHSLPLHSWVRRFHALLAQVLPFDISPSRDRGRSVPATPTPRWPLKALMNF
jgi:hypothetical protein